MRSSASDASSDAEMSSERRVLPGTMTGAGLRVRIDGSASDATSVRIEPAAGQVRGPVSILPDQDDGPWAVDISGLLPNHEYELRLDPANANYSARVRTPPVQVDGEHKLTMALLSCYYPSDEFVRNPARALQCLLTRESAHPGTPHLKIFCGDQIYGDVPAAPFSSASQLYAERYEKAWGRDRLGRLLAYGANVFTGDDHEFWNSYPDRSVYLKRTYDGSWAEWASAGRDQLWTQQGVWNFAPGVTGGSAQRRPWCQWRMADIDFFIADTRTDRTSPDGSRDPLAPAGPARVGCMEAMQLDALLTWIASIERLGILVIGQPLLALGGSSVDNSLPDYAIDYGAILAMIRDAIEVRGVSIIVLSGDIHWGRLVHWHPRAAARADARLVEFVSSAIGRVSIPSILGYWVPDIGSRESTVLDPTRFPDFSRSLPGFDATKEFATNEHNVGVIEIEGNADVRKVTFELWSLEQCAYALDDWKLRPACIATVWV